MNKINFIGKARLQVYSTKPFLFLWRKRDKLKSDTGFQKNLITNVGRAAFIGLIGNVGSVAAFGWLALGTSTTAATAADTTLGAEIVDAGLARVAASVSRITTTQTNDTLQLTTTFTATGSKTIGEIGFFNAASGGIMGGRKVPTVATTVANTDQLVGTYTIQAT